MTIDTKALRKLRDSGTRGHWRHSHGAICCGTIRVAQADFDTSPSGEVQSAILDQLCESANALPDLLDRLAALEAENKRLRAQQAPLNGTINKLRRENERLREAMNKAVYLLRDMHTDDENCVFNGGDGCLSCMAQEVLASGGDK